MAGFTKEQEAFIENVAWKVGKAMKDEMLKTHIATCPHGSRITRAFWLALGIGFGSGTLSVIAITKLFIP